MVHTATPERIGTYLANHIATMHWGERTAAAELGLTRSTLRRRLANPREFTIDELELIATRLGMHDLGQLVLVAGGEAA